MDLRLTGKTAVVTAASGGIGGAVVRTLIAEGARVLGADRTVSEQLKRSGAVTVEADLLTGDGVAELRRAAESELGGVDLLVNGVGGLAGLDLGALPDLTDETWRRAFELNFFAGVRITRALPPRLPGRRLRHRQRLRHRRRPAEGPVDGQRGAVGPAGHHVRPGPPPRRPATSSRSARVIAESIKIHAADLATRCRRPR
ncbi:SDR family NAD(P)-dependent oxidoreductase [Nonomuraea candida]|uniref:SDR family NAD(P)-dependent oxidoreductase n=1 Tax=Nonomuraea candida TaxID=359159 RepID=UPI00069465A9|nr:SDR family NAD(P)-dependent oxidoreductase [Nonomuraea candida]